MPENVTVVPLEAGDIISGVLRANGFRKVKREGQDGYERDVRALRAGVTGKLRVHPLPDGRGRLTVTLDIEGQAPVVKDDTWVEVTSDAITYVAYFSKH